MKKEKEKKQDQEKPELKRRLQRSKKAFIAALFVLLFFLLFVFHRVGYFDEIVKKRLIEGFEKNNIQLKVEKISTSIFPLNLHIENAEAINKANNEILFRFDSADIRLSISTFLLPETQIDVNSTEITGAKIVIRFDKDGRSNFSGLRFVEQGKETVKFNYASTRFILRDSLVQFGDQSRKVEGEAKDLNFQLEPNLDSEIYSFRFIAQNSHFSYEDKRVNSIDLEAKGEIGEKEARIEYLKIKSPVITANLAGKVEDFQTFKYSFDAIADVNLTEIGSIFSSSSVLSGIGNFKGKITGEGEAYRIEGEISSDSLAVLSLDLRSLQVSAAFKGQNSVYEANGEIIAEMLNAGEFQLYFPKLISEVRGDGDFLRFYLDLQAKAAKLPLGKASNIYISDAVAEYNEQKLSATVNFLSVERFFSEEASNSGISANLISSRNIKLEQIGERTILKIPRAQVREFRYDKTLVDNLVASDTKIDKSAKTTRIETEVLSAKRLRSSDVILKNLVARRIRGNLTENSGKSFSSMKAETLSLEQLNSGQSNIQGIKAKEVDLKQIGNETYLNSRLTQIQHLDFNGAQLADLNIAGVRVSIRNKIINVTSEDIEAGDVLLSNAQNGKLEAVKFEKPFFVLEPSGRYRASLDISLGGGFIGKVKLGKASASIVATNDQVTVSSVKADVMDGKVIGDAVISLNKQKRSTAKINFSDIDLSKFVVAQSGRVIPLSGKVAGTLELAFPETDFKSADGFIEAELEANAGEDNRVPINGKVELVAENGIFNVKKAKLETEKTALVTSGKFSLRDEISDLKVVLSSNDANEVQNLVTWFGLSPEIEKQLEENKIELAGNLYFEGLVKGRLDDPTIDGILRLESLKMQGQDLGLLKSDIFVAPTGIEIRNGRLEEQSGGYVAFKIQIPQPTKDNISVQAVLNNYDSGNLLSALPLEKYLPKNLHKIQARTSGEIILDGLPNKASGSIVLNSTQGKIGNQPFDSFSSRIVLNEALAKIEKLEVRYGESYLLATGNYDGESTEFDLSLEGKKLKISSLLAFIPNSENLPAIDGVVDLTAQAKGEALETQTYNISFSGKGTNISVNGQTIGSIDFRGTTENQLFKSVFVINYENNRQELFAEVNLADDLLPTKVYSNLDNANLTPFLVLYKPSNAEDLNLSGTATGRFLIEGNLASKDSNGNRTFSFDYLNGFLNLSAFSVQINEIPLSLSEPSQIRFNKRELIFDNVKFISAGSVVSIDGRKALLDDVTNDLSINGKVNLRLLDVVSRNTFFGGIAEVSVRLTGLNRNSNLSGAASTENGSLSTFVGSERLDFERIKAKVIFTSNQVQIEEAIGYLGGGKVVASGGALLKNLQLQGFRLDLVGKNITAPLPKNFITTGNAEITITSRRVGDDFDTLISGNIFARRSVYTKDINLADIISTRREASITESSQEFSVPRLELNLIGRDALIVRNNIADLVASVDMKVTGDADNPILIGRITSNEGTLFYRDNKYSIDRGTLEFPIQLDKEPFITLQARTEIQSYQIAIDLRGELSDLSSISLNVRSNPPLPQADIVSLITTGSLSNTETGIPTVAQSGINTAAEILTETLVNVPIRRATDKLFGLNRFEINPVISSIRQIPTARLTVGRQINRNLLVTYSTNLSEDQRQVIALEYRVSDRLSFIAQYQQKSLNNFVQERNSFNFEIRLRKKF